MHLHNQLKECLLDFGPMHDFCAFPLRDFNSAFGHFHTIESLVNNFLFLIQRIHSRFLKGLTGVGKDRMCVCSIPRTVLSDLNL